MTKKILKIKLSNALGLHLRPAALLVETASKYTKCDLKIIKGDLEVNGKSIMGVIMLAAGEGSELIFESEGEGSEDLLEELKMIFENNFGEE